MWLDAPPMQPVNCYRAVSYREKIFVVGNRFDNFHSYMVAQVYDPELSTWSLFKPPTQYRSHFAFAEYRGKFYVIGGADRVQTIQTVEVFDFETNRWDSVRDLPHAFDDPEAIVINDRLIVYDSYADKNVFPPITWCEEESSWKPVNGSKAFVDYMFCPIEDEEEIGALLRDLRDPAASFERTSFDI